MVRCFRAPESICGKDIDDVFAYSTAKSVTIRDHRLGCVYVGSLFLVVVYIGVWSLAYCLGYLQFHTPFGTARFTLQQPTLNGCDPSADSCLDDFPPKDSLNYCCRDDCQKDRAKGPGACHCSNRFFTNYDCAFYDGESASTSQRFGMFVATRVREERQQINTTCSKASAQTCDKLWNIQSNYTRFVLDIEDFTVLLDHAAQAPEIKFFAQARDVDGRLLIKGSGKREQDLCSKPGSWDSSWGGSPATSAPCYVDPLHPLNISLDVFKLSTLLIAAEVDLDAASYGGSNHSARFEGMTMLVNINWFNSAPWRGVLHRPYYTYELSAMSKNAYGAHEIVWAPSRQNRTLIAKHGILLQANIVGQVGAFDFNTLLLQLTASLTLLATATFAVNCIATSCMKYGEYYSRAMGDITADFSEVAVLEELPVEELREKCRTQFLACGGTRVELICRLVNDGYSHSGGSSDNVTGAQSPSTVGAPIDIDISHEARSVPLIR